MMQSRLSFITLGLADPDGHLWEVAYNPFLERDADGSVMGMKQA